MNANKRNVSRKGVTALIAISAIAMMFMALLPVAAIPGSNMATVMGTVTDYNNGEPIEDAQVVISYHGIVRTEYTDAQGMYKFTNVPECYCLKTINVTKEHFRPLSEDAAVSDVTIVDFQLRIEEGEPPIGTVMGTVTDVHNGEPIEGAQVQLQYHDNIQKTITDADGKYMFTQVDLCFCLKTIKVTKESYRPESKDVAVSGVTVVDFQLMIEEMQPPVGTVMGTVTDVHNGEPIEGAQVQLQYHDIIQKTITDADGNYKFTQVDICRCLKNIKVTKESFIPASEDVSVTGVTIVDFQLMIEEIEPPVWNISGTVTDANNGAPIEDAHVYLELNDFGRSSITDADGKYLFDNIPEASIPFLIRVTKQYYRSESAEITVVEVTVVDFELMIEELPPPLKGGTLTGMVTDSETDEPLEGATVTLDYHENKLTVQTDDEGRYTFQGIPICFCLKDLSVSMDGYLQQAMSIAISEGTVQDIVLEPTAPVEDDCPSATDGADGSTALNPSVLLGWAFIYLLFSIAGGVLFVISNRLQNRS